MSHVMTVYCDTAGCKASAEHGDGPRAPLPGTWGEINVDDEWVHFCSARHVIDFLIAKTGHDGAWTKKPALQGPRPVILTIPSGCEDRQVAPRDDDERGVA